MYIADYNELFLIVAQNQTMMYDVKKWVIIFIKTNKNECFSILKLFKIFDMSKICLNFVTPIKVITIQYE